MTDQRSLEAFVQQHVAEHTGDPVEVLKLEPLIGGACQDNALVELQSGKDRRRMVVRRDAASSIKGSLSRRVEHAVINAACDAGVKTPRARWPFERDGGSGYFMDFVGGVAIGRVVTRQPALQAARDALPQQLAAELAKIHTVTPQSHPNLPIGGLGARFDGDPVESALLGLRMMFGEMVEPHPALELAYRWLNENRPTAPETVLNHGDFRTGNFMVGPAGLIALLDWEFAHWGAPEEDIAWLCVRDWRFGQLNKPVGGFASRETFISAYERASGRAVDPAAVHYWEIFGNVRWAAGCVYQGERYLSGKQSDLELIAIARRAAEMEWEALRLIEKGAA